MAVLRQGYNDLLTWCKNNGERGQQLIDEYMEQKNFDEFGKIMSEFTYGSGIKVWWKCRDCDYEWQATICNRVGKDTRCPACINGIPKAIKGETSLEEWCRREENIAWGELLLKEWDYEANEAEGNYIDTVAYSSHKEFNWICSNEKCKKHFKMSTNKRTTNKRKCGLCSPAGTSYPEQFIFWSLNQIYKSTFNKEHLYKSKEKPRGFEYDIWIPEINTAIEYSGEYHHGEIQETEEEKQRKIQNDKEKREKALSEGLTFLEIIETIDESKQPERENQYIILSKNANSKGLKNLIRIIFPEESKHIDFIEADRQAIAHSHGKVEEDKQLQNTNPETCLDWDYEKNELGPEYYTYGSGEIVNWKCHICKKEYTQDIHGRSRSSSCPACGYDSKTKKINKEVAKLSNYRDYKRQVQSLSLIDMI